MNMYTVNAIKTFRGRDVPGYNCNLLKNGKKVALVIEDGSGGEMEIDWLDRSNRVTVERRSWNNTMYQGTASVEEAEFLNYVASLPKIPAGNGMPEMFTSEAIVIDDLVNAVLMEKKITSDLKKKLMIRTSKGEFYTWKLDTQNTLERLKPLILKKHPEAQILNELPVPKVIELFSAAGLIQ